MDPIYQSALRRKRDLELSIRQIVARLEQIRQIKAEEGRLRVQLAAFTDELAQLKPALAAYENSEEAQVCEDLAEEVVEE